MKIHRFWTNQLPVGPEANLTQFDLMHQIKDVLQLRPGEVIHIFDSQQEKTAELLVVSKQEIKIKLGENITPLPRPKVKLHLAVSLLKGDSIDEIMRECTPLGILDIQPLVCDRSIVRELKPNKLNRLKLIATEATEQSGWIDVPKILPTQQFSSWILAQNPKQTILFHHPASPLSQVTLTTEITFIVGPEGGWTENELSLAQENGIRPASLSPATLTARLAPVVSCAAILALSGS